MSRRPIAVAFVMVPQARPQPPAPGIIPRLSSSPLPEKGRATHRLVPLLRSMAGEEGSFELGPLALPDGPAYLFVYRAGAVNHVERLDPDALGEERRIELDAGVSIAGRVVSPSGEPSAGVLIHVGELWSNDTENVVGRVRSGPNGEFRFTGLDSATPGVIAGTDRQDGEPEVRRESYFVAVFPPDVLLAVDGQPTSESPIWNARVVTPGDDELELTAAARSQGLSLDVRLLDARGRPIRDWTRAIVHDGAGGWSPGQLGSAPGEHDFFADHRLSVPSQDDPADSPASRFVLVLPGDFRWAEVALDDARPDAVIDVFARAAWRCRFDPVDGGGGRAARGGAPSGWAFRCGRPTAAGSSSSARRTPRGGWRWTRCRPGGTASRFARALRATTRTRKRAVPKLQLDARGWRDVGAFWLVPGEECQVILDR